MGRSAVKRLEFGLAFNRGNLFFEKSRGCTTSQKFVFVYDSTHEVLTEMFTVLCWLSLATFPSVHANCCFAGKIRNTKHTCYGAVSPLSLQVWREQRTFQKEHRRVSVILDRSREKIIAADRLS